MIDKTCYHPITQNDIRKYNIVVPIPNNNVRKAVKIDSASETGKSIIFNIILIVPPPSWCTVYNTYFCNKCSKQHTNHLIF